MRRTRQLRFSVIRSLRTLVSLIYRGLSPISFKIHPGQRFDGSCTGVSLHPLRQMLQKLSGLCSVKTSPGADKESNWLTAPTGKFILMLRMYWPNENDPSIIDGTWTIPAAKKVVAG